MDNDHQISLPKFIAITVLIIAIPLVFSQLLVRYVYTQWLEPESTAGTIMLASAQVDQLLEPAKNNILILGNSRVGEGFSSQIANAHVDHQQYNFISLGLPGTTPRIWFYVLKKIDPQGVKFHAVYLMGENYRDTAEENYNNREVDTAYLSAILTLQDLATYPSSYEDAKKSEEATKNILFPIAPLQKDVAKFFANPKARIKKVTLWRKDYASWMLGYGGKDERLPALEDIQHTDAVMSQLPPEKKPVMEWYFEAVTRCNQEYQHSFRYNSRWFGDISKVYQGRATQLGVFMIPRGPYHQQMGCDHIISGAMKSLSEKKALSLIPSQITLDLENPAYFFDHLHVNAEGRKIFSARLAVAIIDQLEE